MKPKVQQIVNDLEDGDEPAQRYHCSHGGFELDITASDPWEAEKRFVSRYLYMCGFLPGFVTVKWQGVAQ